MATITVEQVKQLLSANRAVAAYPKKKQVVVDGFKRYPASPAAIKAVQDHRAKCEREVFAIVHG